jgi:hypothetical protein
MERSRDLERHGHSTTGQGEHANIWIAGVRAEGVREALAGISAIVISRHGGACGLALAGLIMC